ncbi:hypothetical protein B0H17DRAFT_1290052 [Mycena rosella]|uniref:Uncharacterized protein n=1 Tax=Mycena rosella TaxID=1033263 RepID=A0AAD7GE21_MYCRO|nr:hypothetical protein B0H17DRAFT_1290052 [Mycena rosella]
MATAQYAQLAPPLQSQYTQHQQPHAPQYAQRGPIPANRFSSASDTPPRSLRSSVASSSTSPTSLDHEQLPSPSFSGPGASHLQHTAMSSRRSSETSRTLPRFAGPRRERTVQDRAMSMSAMSAASAAATLVNAAANSSSSTVAKAPKRAAPIVYPALLSRVADAFRQRVPCADRVKDGLTYHDAFDGREAVDRIAHIIKTTDRNLALLLGRALDA